MGLPFETEDLGLGLSSLKTTDDSCCSEMRICKGQRPVDPRCPMGTRGSSSWPLLLKTSSPQLSVEPFDVLGPVRLQGEMAWKVKHHTEEELNI
ncbi:hypothetical protein PBY51_017040 [Eleginops maclovinus]|uniref:Uncharacterized protein n=1 Tax=Eleginops maclovinus TaxID=56733 RepID=A0AAN7WNV5_ELEMC|nr:hypothetical protein PBY51_017040 [Eleginops maclovinus]